jgi:hypothetical protein
MATKLERVLARRGESIRGFAGRIGVSEGTVRAILSGGGTTVETAGRIVEGLDGEISFSDLVPPRKARQRR